MKVLIFSASIGEGHDLPARVLAEGIEREAPATEIEIVDSLAVVGWITRRLVMDSSRFHSKWGSRLFDLSYRLITDVRPTRWFAGHLTQWLAARSIRRAVLERDPDIVVSTYPGTTEVLGDLRSKGRIDAPVVSAITDLAALRYWAHPGVDLHLITHPESAEEVRQIAPGTDVRCVRGLTDERFYEPRTQADARRELGLPADGPMVIVSGGGWAVGDLEGAAEEALRRSRLDRRLPLREERGAAGEARRGTSPPSRGSGSRGSPTRCPIGSRPPTSSSTPPRG